MGWLTLFLLVATSLIIIVPTARGIGLAAQRENGNWQGLLWWSLVSSSPSVFHLYALWAVRRAFVSIATGGIFGPAVATGCVRAGIALAIGATMSAVGAPNLYRLLQASGVPGGPELRLGAVLYFDTAYLAVGVVGLALILLGRLIARAAELQGEAARLQGELDTFF